MKPLAKAYVACYFLVSAVYLPYVFTHAGPGFPPFWIVWTLAGVPVFVAIAGNTFRARPGAPEPAQQKEAGEAGQTARKTTPWRIAVLFVLIGAALWAFVHLAAVPRLRQETAMLHALRSLRADSMERIRVLDEDGTGEIITFTDKVVLSGFASAMGGVRGCSPNHPRYVQAWQVLSKAPQVFTSNAHPRRNTRMSWSCTSSALTVQKRVAKLRMPAGACASGSARTYLTDERISGGAGEGRGGSRTVPQNDRQPESEGRG